MNDVVEIEKGPLRLWLRLLGTANLLAGELGARLRVRHGISLAQFDYLAQLHRSGEADVAMSELGRRLMVTSGNVTGLTDRLERQGFVIRVPHPTDGRAVLAEITDAGRLVVERATADLHDHATSFNADNMHDLCLPKPPRGAKLARVTIGAGLIQDPDGDPNLAQRFAMPR